MGKDRNTRGKCSVRGSTGCLRVLGRHLGSKTDLWKQQMLGKNLEQFVREPGKESGKGVPGRVNSIGTGQRHASVQPV